MLNKQLLIYMGIGVAVLAIVVALIFNGTKGAHVRLEGKVLKERTGALDENTSAAILDFRISNPADIVYVVRDVTVTMEKADGTKVEGRVVSKTDMNQLLQYNKFLGVQYNDVLTIKDRVPAHGQVDRMVAVTFDVPQAQLDKAKSITMTIGDMDGAEFETVFKPS